jgi:uncharacterized protein DUF6348
MPWIRRERHDAEPPSVRLPDLEFLALVQSSLEECAPGVTQGTRLKGQSLFSPQGWVIAVAPQTHGGDHHYDLVAFPHVDTTPGAGMQNDLPCFVDCAVAMSGNPRHAADMWVQTAGMCLLELRERRGRFADHIGPGDQRHVPGWHTIASGAGGFGLEVAQTERLQTALLEANVLSRVADAFTADLESPFFNGIKVFYGGQPGAMNAEIRVNGDRHEAASAAMAALGLPEPTVFTAVRYFALMLPAAD